MIINLIKKYYIAIGILLIVIYFAIYYIPTYITGNLRIHQVGTFSSIDTGLPKGVIVRINDNNAIAIMDSTGKISIRKMPIVYKGIIDIDDIIK